MNETGKPSYSCAETEPSLFTPTNLQRFEDRYIPEPMSGCWLWTGTIIAARKNRRYGIFYVSGRNIRAHRYSYELLKGPIPNDLMVCHTCDNTFCVNPDHLFLGTNRDNVDDMLRKGRQARILGERNGKAKITEVQASHVRWMLTKKVAHALISEATGVPLGTVRSISIGKCWGWVTPAVPRSRWGMGQ